MIDVIHFYQTNDLQATHDFYHNILGFDLYKDQGKCRIYDLGIGKIGFCTHFPGEGHGCLTFVYSSKEEVNQMYRQLKEMNVYLESQPNTNEYFKIYHFFAKDPNGIKVEFQYFLEEL